MAPALRIPISANVQEFEQGMEKARSTTIRSVQFIAKEFASLNKEFDAAGLKAAAFGVRAAGAAAGMTKGFIATRVAIAAAALAIGGAIIEARRQLEEMVEIAEKSSKVGVSAELFQGFLLAARNLKVEAKDLEGALTRAFEATKEKIDQTLPLLDRLREFFLAGLVGEGAQGLDLFRNAKDQDQKVRAILVAMIELEKAGERLAAQDIGERMFGAKFIDNMRQGNTSAQEILANIDKINVAGGSAFSTELVKRAAELDKELKKAHQTLEENLRPAWEGLADVALTIKGVWVEIVKLLGSAAGLLTQFGSSSTSAMKQFEQEREEVVKKLQNNEGAFGGYFGLTEAGRRQLEKRLEMLNLILDAQKKIDIPPPGVTPEVPMPRSNPLKVIEGHASKFKDIKESAKSESDAFTRTQDALEKRIALEGAVGESIGKTNEEREYAKALAEQWAAAERAGLPITAELMIQMSELADRWGEVSSQSENAKLKFQEMQNASRELGSALSDAFKNAVIHGKSLADTLKLLSERLLSRGIDKLFDAFFAAPGGGGGSQFSKLFSSVFGGPKAGGGPVYSGKTYLVGESGPEMVRMGASGTVIPNQLVSGGGGGNFYINVENKAGAQIQTQPGRAADGSPSMKIIVDMVHRELAGSVARGGSPLNSAFESRYGASPARGNAR